MSSSPAPPGRRRPVFMRLGILVVRHPWYPVIFWLILLAVSVPAAMRSSTATTANATGLPDSYPSVVASHEMNSLFPNSSPASTSLLVLYGTNFTGATGRDSILSLGTALAGNTSLTTLANVTSLYAAYESYLYGEVRLALGIWIQADSSSPNVTAAVQGTAELVWGPPSLYLTNWEALVAQHANQSPLAQNYPAFVETNASLNGTPGLQANLSRFYYGLPGVSGGFNGTPGCGGAPSTAPNCSDAVVRALLPEFFGAATLAPPAVPALTWA
ncbi:MAG TPA: hypothetical protein VJS68_01720, partial [Thermoplasmata archaeon]|nr:hypothetical protein [Thermoplasmata archaeon]